MELKLRLLHRIFPLVVSFNRTFMELKLVKLRNFMFSLKAFNRTFMELKLAVQHRFNSIKVRLKADEKSAVYYLLI